MCRTLRGLLLAGTCLTVAACDALAPVVRYTDELTDSSTGRTVFVRGPAQVFGLVGFIAGVPIEIVALPGTYIYYRVRKSQETSPEPDPVTIFLFPSFWLWRAAALLATPFDLLEFAVYRGWLPPKTLTADERRNLEDRIDAETLPRHPVQPVYPKPRPSDGRDDRSTPPR